MRAMRRSDREITDRNDIEDIIKKSRVCRLALADGNQPYIIPLNFGYRDNVLYFHSARDGKKIDILKRNPAVCFEFDIDHELVIAEKACDWGMKYRSVIGFGTASLVENMDQRHEALAIIMRQYSTASHEFDRATVHKTAIIKVEIEMMTGKKKGF
jgi:nitroimidazol reductase NimA-like FMN-containing flavoprotein (pyridoxamine 5'-phosphate oxidase superfamily)